MAITLICVVLLALTGQSAWLWWRMTKTDASMAENIARLRYELDELRRLLSDGQSR